MKLERTVKIIGGIAVAVAAGLSTVQADVTYYLNFDPASSPEAQQVADSVAEAAEIYNTYGSFNKNWWVTYNTGIPTAEASYDGYMGYGGSRNARAAMHEGGHTMGVGQYSGYWANMVGGVWQGTVGRETAIEMGSQYDDGMHGDNTHIWPWGLNFDNEDSYLNRIKLVRILAAMRCDMGILAFSKEAENEMAVTGATAVFHVESPVATSYQWYKGGAPLSNGGDISGADTDTLQIANADASDEGSYYCRATGAGETLNSRARQLFVEPLQQLGQWDMDGSVADSVNTNSAVAYGTPAYTTGKIGQAIDLDGANDYIQLPDSIGHTKDMTVSTWVYWDGGNNWQRLFDFGTGQYQYMFLTPKSDAGTMKLSFRDAKNGADAEQAISTTALPTGQWVHLVAVLNAEYATLYVNGQAVGSTAVPVTDLVDFLPTQNYIGKSQFSDPLFNGRVDDFRVYNYALSGSDVWDLWGQSANSAPAFSSETIVLSDVELAAPCTGLSLAGYATDADLDALTFEKAGGPAWLSVSTNGTLSGNPGSADLGDNVFFVRVTDPSGAGSDAEVRITVTYPSSWSALSGTVIGTSGSWQSNPTLTKAAAFDGDLATYYDAVNGSGDWTGLDLGSAQQISLIKYAPRSDQASRMVGGRFQGSNTADFSGDVVTFFTVGTPPPAGSLTEQVIADAGTYRYVRYIGPDEGFCNVAEIEFYRAGEPNFDGDPVATGTSIGSTGSYSDNPNLTRDAALDGDLATYYDAANASGDWVGLDLGLGYEITEISYAPRSGFANRMVGGVFEAANTPDFSSGAVTLFTVPSAPADAMYTTVAISDPGTYRFVRYVGPDNGYCDVAEIVVQGIAEDVPAEAPPTAPVGLAAIADNGSVDLDWADNAEPDLAGYTVYRSTASGGGYIAIASNLAVSAWTDSTVFNGATYYYVVTATDTLSIESSDSAEVSATPLSIQSIAIENPGFELPAAGKISDGLDGATDVPGWNAFGTMSDSGIESASFTAHSGDYAAYLQGGDGGAYQMTGYAIQEGDVITVGYWARVDWAENACDITATLFWDTPNAGANEIGSYTASGLSASWGYFEYTIEASAASVGHELGIEFRNMQNDWAALDDVSIQVVKNGFNGYMADCGLSGALFGGDANSNGVPNGMEYFLGRDPADMASDGRVLSLVNGGQSVVYPFNPAASGVIGTVEWTTNLVSGSWVSTGVTYSTNTVPAEIEANLVSGAANDHLYIRLRVDSE